MQKILRYYPFIYLFIGFVPYLGRADKKGPQWLILSIFLLINIIILYVNKVNLEFKKTKLNINFIVFIVLCIISMFDAYNIQESIIEFSRILILYCLFFFIINCNTENKNLLLKYLPIVFTIILVFESIWLLNNFFSTYEYSIYKEFGRSPLLKGTTANINIAAFSLISKSCFLIYFFEKKFSIINKIIISILLLAIFFCISITGSRGGLLSIYFLLFMYLIYILYFFIKTKNFIYLIRYLYVSIPFIINFFITENIFKSLSTSFRTAEIIKRGSDSRLEYYRDAINAIIDNPLNGVGLGNWKISSIYYNKENMIDFIVPYHVHNDFLEIGTELGIFGLISFSFFFFYISIKLIYLFFAPHNKKGFNIILFCTFLFVGIFSIDSMLNFPFSRPMMIVPFIFILALFDSNKIKTHEFSY